MKKVENKGNRSKLIAAVVFLFLVLILVIIFLGIRKNDSVQEPEITEDTKAIISIIEGNPEVKVDGAEEFLEVTDGAALTKGDEIRTDENSRALILFANNSSLSLDYSGHIILNEIPEAAGGKVDILQEAGKAWHRIEKLNSSDEYNVTTPTSIAAVRGTKFISHVKSDIVSNIHTVESEVEVSPYIDGEMLESTIVKAGDWVDVYESKKEEYQEQKLGSFVRRFEERKDRWFLFNECLDDVLDQEVRTISNLRQKFQRAREIIRELRQCREELQNETETTPTNTGTPTPTPTSTPAVPQITSINVNFSNNQFGCSWEASGDGIIGFEYSFGSSPEATDIAQWKQTQNKAVTYGVSPTNLESGSTYYCNVRAVSEWGNSAVKSQGVMVDVSQGTINVSEPSTTSYFNGKVSGNGAFRYMNANDLEVRFYIRNVQGKYCDGTPGGWMDGLIWIYPAVNIGTDNFGNPIYNFSKVGLGSDTSYDNATLHVEVRNKKTGKLLDKKNLTLDVVIIY